jgi:APA family basic amino acid/polyamine antiporter
MTPPELARRLGTSDAVVLGLGAMLGAGIFAAPAPAARAAGAWLPVAVLVAGFVAWCNATSTAALAALMPQAGGTYVYAGRVLGPGWGHLAGWGFVTGKTASCTAMALTVGLYAWPEQPRVAATVALVLTVALGAGGVQRGARTTRVLVAVVLAVLALVVVAGLGVTGTTAPSGDVAGADMGGPAGLLPAAGLMFFAFAGYARLATLGEEVREPARVIPRAVAVALAVVVTVYLVVVTAALLALGPARLAASSAPLADVVAARGWDALVPVVRLGAVAAATGALLSLLLGVSRTAFAMARDGHLPRSLAAVRAGVPHRAELVVGAVVLVLVWTVDLRGAIGVSSLAVLVYYLLANLSARRLGVGAGRSRRWGPVAGAVGCVLLALTLPPGAVLAGGALLALGAAVRVVVAAVRRSRTADDGPPVP